MDDNVIWGKPPEVGDKVYVDFGDSITDHPEITGVVTQVLNTTHFGEPVTYYFIDGHPFALEEMVHIEVLDAAQNSS